MRVAVLPVVLFLALSGIAQAADRKINDFYGRWIGTGQATQGVVATESRDSEVVLEKLADGFKISWTTMSSSIADGSKSKVKTSSLNFRRGKSPMMFIDAKTGNSGDGRKTSWARLSGDTLSIMQLVIADDGQWDVTTYERTLKDADHMDATFTRITNGETVKRAKLKMTRARE